MAQNYSQSNQSLSNNIQQQMTNNKINEVAAKLGTVLASNNAIKSNGVINVQK